MTINIPKKSGPALPAFSGKAASAVVILHGYGADAMDLFPLAQQWQPALPDTVFVSLNAPYPCEASPMGRQWFSLFDIDASNRNGALTYWPQEKLLSGLRGAAEILNHWCDEILLEYKIPPSRLALTGFSQGCMMALHTGLRRDAQIACIAGFSGRLLAPELLAAEIKSKPPIMLVHGDADDIVPPQSLALAEQALRAQGVEVAAEMRPNLAHGIDEHGLEMALELFKRTLA